MGNLQEKNKIRNAIESNYGSNRQQAAQRAEPLLSGQKSESQAKIQKKIRTKTFYSLSTSTVLSPTFFPNSVIF